MSQLDSVDAIATKAFEGYVVRKDLVRKYARQYPVPTYVVEFLLGRYCATTNPAEIEEGLRIVEQQLKDRTVRTGEEELFKSRDYANSPGAPVTAPSAGLAAAAAPAFAGRPAARLTRWIPRPPSARC